MTLIRRLVGRRNLRELDAFPKTIDTYTESTAAGGTVSIVSYLLIVILVTSEVKSYFTSKVAFYYKVDDDFNSKLKINVDITVAMPCETIGADIIDVTNQNNAYTYGRLVEEMAYFELTSRQRFQWDAVRQVNTYLRDEYHSMRDFLWRKDSRTQAIFGRDIPPRDELPTHLPDACRLHGTLTVNKVAGNFHITVGKHIPLPIGHAHISLFTSQNEYNFSHRIERFSFGDHVQSIINPLEGEEKVASTNVHLYNYYIKVVSTDVQTSDLRVKTYQYSTTAKERAISHETGSHGMPGIYFKYEIDPISVTVAEEYIPFWRFLVRLCGIAGGIYATSGLVNIVISAIVDVVTCKYLVSLQSDVDSSESETKLHPAEANGTNGLFLATSCKR